MHKNVFVFAVAVFALVGTALAGSRSAGRYLAELSNFHGVDQKGFKWCWVAVSAAAIRQQTGIRVSQCRLAGAVTGDARCCGWFNTSCDRTGSPSRALDQAGLNGPGKAYTGRVNGQRVLEHLRRDLPVIIHVRLYNAVDRATYRHVVTVYAISFTNQHGWIYSVYDPMTGYHEYNDVDLSSVDRFGVWENTTFVGKFQGDENYLNSLR